MATTDNGSLIQGLYDAFNRRDLGRAVELASPDCRWTQVPFGTTSRGSHALKDDMQGWLEAFPDSKVEVQNVIAAGDYVCVEFTGRGTHNGTLRGPGGDIGPTGRKVELKLCDIYYLRNGKVIDGKTYYDVAGLMTQLGIKG